MSSLSWSDQCFNVSDAYFRWLFRMAVSDFCSRWLFRIPFSDDSSGLLFRMTISDACFRLLFRITVPDDCSKWLFRMPISDDFFIWLFRITVPDEYFGCLFVIPGLILILATNSYFHGRFLFQPIIRLIGPTTDSFLNDGFLLKNYGPNAPWYHTVEYLHRLDSNLSSESMAMKVL